MRWVVINRSSGMDIVRKPLLAGCNDCDHTCYAENFATKCAKRSHRWLRTQKEGRARRPFRLARGDVHRDFKAKTHIGETWRDPLHRTSADVKKPV
jgi:hypothetical protein